MQSTGFAVALICYNTSGPGSHYSASTHPQYVRIVQAVQAQPRAMAAHLLLSVEVQVGNDSLAAHAEADNGARAVRQHFLLRVHARQAAVLLQQRPDDGEMFTQGCVHALMWLARPAQTMEIGTAVRQAASDLATLSDMATALPRPGTDHWAHCHRDPGMPHVVCGSGNYTRTCMLHPHRNSCTEMPCCTRSSQMLHFCTQRFRRAA